MTVTDMHTWRGTKIQSTINFALRALFLDAQLKPPTFEFGVGPFARIEGEVMGERYSVGVRLAHVPNLSAEIANAMASALGLARELYDAYAGIRDLVDP